MSLAPCPSCSRHVRTSEATCPFCAASVSLIAIAPRSQVERLGRAALFSVFAASVTACNVYGGPPERDAAIADDAGTDAAILAMYGGPPVDAGTDAGLVAAYGGPPHDSGTDT